MLRVLPYLIELVLVVVCLIDLAQTRPNEARNLPRWAWLLLILVVPFVGAIGWFVAGRPRGAGRPDARPEVFPSYSTHTPVAPDDDPEFLSALAKQNEHEDLLRRWEEDLKRREDDLRRSDDTPDATTEEREQ